MQPLTALEAGAFNAGMAGVLMGWPDLLPSTEQNSAQTLLPSDCVARQIHMGTSVCAIPASAPRSV